MGQQLKSGTQFPLRPALMLIDVKDGPHNIVSDAAPVDWTAAATIIDLLLDTEVMDDTDEITIDSVSFGLSLKEGQYEIVISSVSSVRPLQRLLSRLSRRSGRRPVELWDSN